jgi:hypothetical protein
LEQHNDSREWAEWDNDHSVDEFACGCVFRTGERNFDTDSDFYVRIGDWRTELGFE